MASMKRPAWRRSRFCQSSAAPDLRRWQRLRRRFQAFFDESRGLRAARRQGLRKATIAPPTRGRWSGRARLQIGADTLWLDPGAKRAGRETRAFACARYGLSLKRRAASHDAPHHERLWPGRAPCRAIRAGLQGLGSGAWRRATLAGAVRQCARRKYLGVPIFMTAALSCIDPDLPHAASQDRDHATDAASGSTSARLPRVSSRCRRLLRVCLRRRAVRRSRFRARAAAALHEGVAGVSRP